MKQQTESPDNVGINVTEMVTMVELTLEFWNPSK
jgi:predicted metal-binding protein